MTATQINHISTDELKAQVGRLQEAIRWYAARDIDRMVTVRINRVGGECTYDDIERWAEKARETLSKTPPPSLRPGDLPNTD